MKKLGSELKALGDSNIRSIAAKSLLLHIPLVLLTIVALPVTATAVVAMWIQEGADSISMSRLFQTPLNVIHSKRESLYERAADIKRKYEKENDNEA